MRAERARKNRAYATGTGVVIVSLLALTLTVWALRPARLDAETLCPIDRPLAGHTLVILDRTDRWNAAMGDTLDQLIETAQRETPQGGKFSIVSLDANQSTHPLFSAIRASRTCGAISIAAGATRRATSMSASAARPRA